MSVPRGSRGTWRIFRAGQWRGLRPNS